jgi:hypoxia up-regulated 1
MAARCFLTILVIAIMTICLTRNMGVDGAAVISIDFSSEWIKIALVKPGVPMEIVLNKESKRKTAAVVALRNDERSFSESAATTAVKYPKTAYRYVQFLAGLAYDNPLVAQYKKWFPFYDIREDPDRGTIIFNHDE